MKADPTAARKMRSERSKLYAQLETGALTIHELLSANPPACIATTTVYAVLLRCPGVGKRKARTILERAEVWPMTELGQLVPWECERLLTAIHT